MGATRYIQKTSDPQHLQRELQSALFSDAKPVDRVS
jgi:hypothetical protein